MTATGQARPVAHTNRVVYELSGVRQLYIVGPFGLEQGFSVTRRPHGEQGQPTVALRRGGPLVARRSGTTIVVLAHGHVALRHWGLEATDAAGRLLPATMALRGRRLTLRDRSRAAYPVSIDPFMQQPETLTAGWGDKPLPGGRGGRPRLGQARADWAPASAD